MPYSCLRKGRVSVAGQVYLITTVTHRRHPVLADLRVARRVVREMRTLHDRGDVESLAWVLMPDHLHWLFGLGDGHCLADAVGRFKGRSGYMINQLLGRRGPVWQESFHDHALRRDEDLASVARYVVANPLRAGMVKRLGDYAHWDAVWL
ncbi:REP-associated tyrosine transposase [Thioalkalivibrio denitrificans]|nr:transposase [Thioalkalivibrio denitrificans]